MKDVKITKAVINERQELSVNILVKPEDYDKTEYHLLCKGKTDGYTYDMDITWCTLWKEDVEIKQKRKDLSFQMWLYEDRMQLWTWAATKALYSKYNIKSRTELTASQLDQEIDYHVKAWLDATQ